MARRLLKTVLSHFDFKSDENIKRMTATVVNTDILKGTNAENEHMAVRNLNLKLIK